MGLCLRGTTTGTMGAEARRVGAEGFIVETKRALSVNFSLFSRSILLRNRRTFRLPRPIKS